MTRPGSVRAERGRLRLRLRRVLVAGSLAWLALTLAAVALDTLFYFKLLGVSHALVRVAWRVVLWTSPWVLATVVHVTRGRSGGAGRAPKVL